MRNPLDGSLISEEWEATPVKVLPNVSGVGRRRVVIVRTGVGTGMVTPTIVEREPMTVVGLQTTYSGEDAEIQALWTEFGERWEEFEDLAATDEGFGVVTDFQSDPVRFVYTVGVATETADIPEDFVVVEVPGGTYARFETTIETMQSDYEAVLVRWLPDSAYDRVDGPEYERYTDEFDPEERPTYEYFFPVRDADE